MAVGSDARPALLAEWGMPMPAELEEARRAAEGTATTPNDTVAIHHGLRTSGIVQASKTSSRRASKVRSSRSPVAA
ncbi:MAG: hypothetical protein ACR2IN_06320 [Thermoleophilaceae bacterium]